MSLVDILFALNLECEYCMPKIFLLSEDANIVSKPTKDEAKPRLRSGMKRKDPHETVCIGEKTGKIW